MAKITEKKEVFYMEVSVETATVNVENIKVDFNKIELSCGGDEVVITDRKCYSEVIRTLDGFKVKLYIVNDIDDYEKRIDYLIDDDYEIINLDLSIINEKFAGKKYEYTINPTIGEQIEKEFPVELDETTEAGFRLACGYIDDKRVSNYVYQLLVENEDLLTQINALSKIAVL